MAAPKAGQADTPSSAEEPGLLGDEVDPTPNENYTVAGVTAGKPTPETDDKAAADARRASRR
jgi:hypothetical protein